MQVSSTLQQSHNTPDEREWLIIKAFNPSFVLVVTCLPLSAPEHGIVSNCTLKNHSRVTTDRQPVGSVCDAVCNDGYTLSGSASRNCLMNGTWDGTDANCTG